MKVLMINVVCGIRSTGRICTDLASALEAQGHEVKIAYGRENVPKQFQKYAVRIGTDFGVKIHGVKARVLDAAGFGSKYATKKFVEWIKVYDPDVIHLHNLHGYYINVEVLFGYLKCSGKKVIWTLHDCWAFTGHSAYCDAVKCERWIQGCYQCPQIKEYPKAFIDKSKRNWEKKKDIFSGVPDMSVITPSHWLAGLTRKSFLSEYPVEVIHNGIDTSQFMPLENDFREFYHLEDKFIVLGVATAWSDLKGYSDFLKLAEMLDDNFKIVMVGLTEKQLKELPPKIIGIKRTASLKELVYIYSASDVLLNLTYCDNYPNVNLEAIACGTPVITYDTGGSSESAGACGYVVPQGDIKAIYDIIRKIKIDQLELAVDRLACDNKRTTREYLKEYGGGYWKKKALLGLIGKRVVIGVAAVWDKRKGLDDFVRLNSILDSDDYSILIAGITEKQKTDLPNNMIGITRTDSVKHLANLYSIADVFVNPTVEDNYPTTNLEAIACGTPVITYKTGGSPESAVLFGKAVEENTVENIVDEIVRLRFTPDKRDYVDKDKTIEQYLNYYQI